VFKKEYTGFGTRLDYLIKEKGIMTKDLAEKTGIAPVDIRRYRKGKHTVHNTKHISNLARELNVKASWLLYGYLK
jgi:transcriptional regulator with XRE-family HTH domain